MKTEANVERQEETSSVEIASSKSPKSRIRRAVKRVIVFAALTIVALIVAFIIVFVAFVSFHVHPLVTLYGAEHWAALVANVIVIFYSFPAFKRTKNRGFLYLGFAAIAFMYGVLFGLVFPAKAMSLGQREFYYGVKYLVYIAGLGLYARGIMLLARNGKLAPTEHVPNV